MRRSASFSEVEDGSFPAYVTLVSSDNVQLLAARKPLSMSSSYFDKLLCSEFAEANTSLVSISIDSSLLREILEFIHTTSCDRLGVILTKVKTSVEVSCEDVRALVQLADAADYTCVGGLLKGCEQALKNVMRRYPHLACTTVEALGKKCLAWGQGVLQEAVDTTVNNPEQSLLLKYEGCALICGLEHLDAQGAEIVFASVKTQKPEMDKLFQALIVWATGAGALLTQWKRPSWSGCKIVVDTESMEILDDRRETAMRIALWFDLGCLRPCYLSNIVERSGLVGQDMVYAAYKEQSKQLEELTEAKEENTCSSEFNSESIKCKLSRREDDGPDPF